MNPVNLYISTCRYVIQSNPNDQETWVELYRYLPYLRQSLSCCVCTRIFDCPMGPEFSKCQHHVCKACIGGKMRLKPVCGWCNNFDTFVEKPQLKVIVQCFKKLCDYLATSAIANNLSSTDNGGTSNNNQLLTIIQEAVTTDNDCSSVSSETLALNPSPPVLHKIEDSSSLNPNSTLSPVPTIGTKDSYTEPPIKPFKKRKKSKGKYLKMKANYITSTPSLTNGTDSNGNGIVHIITDCQAADTKIDIPELTKNCDQKTADICRDKIKINSKISETVKAEHDYIKEFPVGTFEKGTVQKVKSRKCSSHALHDGESSCKKTKLSKSEKFLSVSKNNNNSIAGDKSKLKTNSKTSKTNNYGCRCGLATPKPGSLTCCGQRCPCYSAFKGCEDCKCRGCRNPRGDPAKNPLAAMRLKRQLQNVQIIQTSSAVSHAGIENIEISQTLLPMHACIEDEDIDIDT